MVHLIPHRIVVLSPQREPSVCIRGYVRPFMFKNQQPNPVLERFAIGVLRFFIHNGKVCEKRAQPWSSTQPHVRIIVVGAGRSLLDTALTTLLWVMTYLLRPLDRLQADMNRRH